MAAEQFRQFQIARQQRLLEIRRALPEVVGRHRGDALARHRAAEQAGLHRRVNDHPDIVGLRVRQDLFLDLRRNDRIRRLQRRDRRDGLRAPHLVHVEVRHADVPHLALPAGAWPSSSRPPRPGCPVPASGSDTDRSHPTSAGCRLCSTSLRIDSGSMVRRGSRRSSHTIPHLVNTSGLLDRPASARPTTSSECPRP